MNESVYIYFQHTKDISDYIPSLRWGLPLHNGKRYPKELTSSVVVVNCTQRVLVKW